MKLFIFILLSFNLLNPSLVYASSCFKPDPVKKDLEKANKKVSVASNKQIQKPIPKHVLEQAQKSVWQIEDFLPEGIGLNTGTGFFISKNEFVTSFHVLIDHLTKNSDRFVFSHENTYQSFEVKKVKHLSPLYDLAILEIKGEVSDYLNLAEKDPEPKENLSLVGYSNGNLKIIDKTYDISYESEFEYVYSIKYGKYSGASGSPILNSKGEVIGIAHSANKNQLNVVKIIHLKNLLKQDSPSFQHPSDHLKHSIKEFEKMAKKRKNIIAQYRLGVMHAKSLLGEGSGFGEAVDLFRKAAKKGYAPAQGYLGYLHQEGLWGVKKDLKEAARWYEKAAEQGDAEAQFNLGIMYATGQGVKEDPKEAARWFREAAEQGYMKAQFNLGVMHEKGQGVEQDLKEAARWYEKAAEQGDAEAQFNLGIMYVKGQGVEENFEEATRWFREAAEQGYMKAQFNLGIMYATGWGVKENFKEGVYWLEKAAEQGDAEAQFQMGVMYQKGQGVKKDLKEAARWIRKAVEQRYAPALEMLDKNPELLKLVRDMH